MYQESCFMSEKNIVIIIKQFKINNYNLTWFQNLCYILIIFYILSVENIVDKFYGWNGES